MFAHPEFLVSRLLFVGLMVESFEIFSLRHAFAEGAIFSRSNIAILTSGTRWQVRVGATWGESYAIGIVAVIQALLAMLVIAEGTGASVGVGAALMCLVTNGYIRSRRQIGGSGAEQLTFIALVTFGLVIFAGGTQAARRVGDGFLTAQVILAYVASGIAKAVSPVWRKGQAMTGILSTEGYGTPELAMLLIRYPSLDRFLCWSVIAWETAFPLVLVVPKPMMIVLLGVGVLFHVSCAVVMGLNRFPWAFCGCYPAVWATAMLLR